MKALPLRILAAAGLLVAVLVGLVVSEDRARATGQEVILPMEAVDPRSLLAGHYSDLSLAQALPPGWACPASLSQPGWIALRPVGDRHLVAGGGATREAARRYGPVVVRGSAACGRVADTGAEVATLEIGVRRFHADQDEAEALDRRLRQGRSAAQAFAVVSVGQDGRARLKGIILDGRRTDLTWW